MCIQRKFIDWKKPKHFRFRWNWDKDKKLRGIRLQISSPSPPQGELPPTCPPICLGGGGKDCVDTNINIVLDYYLHLKLNITIDSYGKQW